MAQIFITGMTAYTNGFYSLTDNDSLTILSSGTLRPGDYNNSLGVALSGSSSLLNAGTIEGQVGVAVYSATARATNIGFIIGTSVGVDLYRGTFGNRGTVVGESAGVFITGDAPGAAYSLLNNGTIVGQAAVTKFGAQTPGEVTISNTGSLISTGNYAVILAGTSKLTLTNSGLVDGAVELRTDGLSTLVNAGMIRNDVFLLDLAGGAVGKATYRATNGGVVLGVVHGDAGADDFSGAAARDHFSGGAGADVLRGYAGQDTLQGGTGADQLRGGTDADTFIYTAATDSGGSSGRDTIFDFNRAEDVIDLSALAGTGRYIGARAFKADGSFQVREVWNKQTKIGTLLVDLNGDRVADMSIVLRGQSGLLTSDNFLL